MKNINIHNRSLKFTTINFILVFTFFSLFQTVNITAATKGNYTGTTIAAGEWTNASNWNQTTAPDPSSDKCDLAFDHDITYNPTGTSPWTNPFAWNNNNTLYIKSGITVTINSDIDIKNNFTITIEPGGKFIVNGNVSINNNVTGTIDGALYISGDLNVNGGGHSTISGSGEIVVDGTITDSKGVITPALTNDIDRWLIADNGNWDVPESWSATSKGAAAVSAPNKQCIVHIESAYTGYLNINSEITTLDIQSGGKLIINPTKTLTVSSDIINNGELELNSDATGTGGLIFNGTATVSATCKRYVTANQFHYVSSPMSAAPVSSYNVTSGGYANPNFYYYDETETNANWLYGWKQANSGNLTLGSGYAFYTDENYAYSLSGGNLQNTDFNVPITNSTTAGGSQSWNLIGNPFPCNVDADMFINANDPSVFTGSLYFWDDDNSGSLDYNSNDYLVYTLGGGTTNGPNGGVFDGTIAPLQGFFVQAVNDGNLTFPTSSKTVTQGTFNKSTTKNNTQKSDLKMIHLSLSAPNGLYNDILLKFADDADEGIDIYDGKKLRGNPNIAFFSLLNEDEYAIQGLPDSFEKRIVKLGWDVEVAGDYSIKAEDFSNISENIEILLKDSETGAVINLREKDYTFHAFGNQTNKISLIFNNNLNTYTEISDIVLSDQIQLINKGNIISVRNLSDISTAYVYDLSGKLIGSEKLIGENTEFSVNASNGYYIIKIINDKQIRNFKVFID